MFIGFYNKSIIVTFIGVFCCVFGIHFCFEGNVMLALIMLVTAGICDSFDGYIASFVKRNEAEKKYGVELDSLADVVCFGLYPVVILASMGFTEVYNMIIYCIYIFCGISRLGYFNVDTENTKCFKGVPITCISFFLPLVMVFTRSEWPLMIFMLIMSFAFVYNIRIGKANLTKKFGILAAGIIIIGLLLIKHFCF